MDKATNKFHALQLFTDTFAAETVHLTNEAIGIYIRLLSFCRPKNLKQKHQAHQKLGVFILMRNPIFQLKAK